MGHQSIFIFKALGSNTQVSYITRKQYMDICSRHLRVEEFRQGMEQEYIGLGKKYDFQRFMHDYHWTQKIDATED